jgi:hypothetical protein
MIRKNKFYRWKMENFFAGAADSAVSAKLVNRLKNAYKWINKTVDKQIFVFFILLFMYKFSCDLLTYLSAQ